MKVLKLLFLFFPLVAKSQKKFDIIGKKLQQNNKYQYVYYFENNYAVFRTFDKKMGVMDSTESIIIKPIFSFIYNKKELKNLFEVGNEVNKKFKRGFIDLRGNIKIPIIYDEVYYFEKGLIIVTKDNKVGVLDTLNNIILPVKFDYISTDNNLIIARFKGINNLYDFQGKQITNLNFIKISYFKHDKAVITLRNKTNSVIDNKGNLLLKPIKDYSFERILDDDLYLIKSNLNLKEGVINSKNEFVINCKYNKIEQVKSFFIAKIHNKKGIISSTDSVIKPFIYDEIFPHYVDDAIKSADNNLVNNYIIKKGGLYGVINPNIGKEIIPTQYKSVSALFNLYYIVSNNENKNGLYSKSGKKILNEDYEFYNVFGNSIFASKDRKCFLITLKAEKFIEKEVFVEEFIKFKDMPEFSNNENQIFKSQNKFGVISYLNKIVIPCEYDFIENIDLSKEFIVKRDNQYGIVDSNNEVVEDIKYDDFKKLKETILFTKDRKTTKKYHQIRYE